MARRKNEVVENEEGLDPQALLSLDTRPEKVAIVALGRSSGSFIQEMMQTRNMKAPFDEVWTVNRGFRGMVHDKLFVMDDLKWLEEIRDPVYAEFLKRHDKPIITSTRYDDYPTSVEYPIDDVLGAIQDDVFCVNTVAYMVAYALSIRVKHISIYGADFSYPNGNFAESGGQAVAYLLGMSGKFGAQFELPQSTTLLYAHQTETGKDGLPRRKRYGWHRRAELEAHRAKLKEQPNDN